ncbi:unnamed protein product [Caenorhabditis brenneri]
MYAPAEPDTSGVCLYCKGLITLPDNNEEAQILLKFACDSIENSIMAGVCRKFAQAVHATSTWPALKWFLEAIKGPSCTILCPSQ